MLADCIVKQLAGHGNVTRTLTLSAEARIAAGITPANATMSTECRVQKWL
jgi:hypothetical protein